MKRVCELCAFWDRNYAYETAVGKCRKNPPTIVPVRHPEDSGDDFTAHFYSGYWPETHPNDWCGAFQSRTEWRDAKGIGPHAETPQHCHTAGDCHTGCDE